LKIELRQGSITESLYLTATRYDPVKQDILMYEGNPEKHPFQLEMPPYRIANIKDASAKMINYIQRTKLAYFHYFLDKNDEILSTTFEMILESNVSMANLRSPFDSGTNQLIWIQATTLPNAPQGLRLVGSHKAD
jgi:hypothetical protein